MIVKFVNKKEKSVLRKKESGCSICKKNVR